MKAPTTTARYREDYRIDSVGLSRKVPGFTLIVVDQYLWSAPTLSARTTVRWDQKFVPAESWSDWDPNDGYAPSVGTVGFWSPSTSEWLWTTECIFGFHPSTAPQVEGHARYALGSCYVHLTGDQITFPERSWSDARIPGESYFLKSEYMKQVFGGCSDFVTDHFDRYQRAGWLITNPCTRARLTSKYKIVQQFVPVVSPKWRYWNNGVPTDVPAQLQGYILVEYFLGPGNLFNDPLSVIGDWEYSLEGWFGNYIGESIFSEYAYTLNEHKILACDAATRGQIDLLTTALEGHQTYSMFVTLFRRVVGWYRLLRDLKKGDLESFLKKLRKQKWRKSQKQIKNLANAWLEFRYGWQQLWRDANDALDAYTHVVKRVERHSFAWRSIEPEGSLQDLIASQKVNDEPIARLVRNPGSYSSLRLSIWGQLQLVAGVGTDTQSDRSLRQRIKSACGGEQFVAAMTRAWWETIPLSFVVDWFIGIGSLIGAASLDPKALTRQWDSVRLLDGCEATLDLTLNSRDLGQVSGASFIPHKPINHGYRYGYDVWHEALWVYSREVEDVTMEMNVSIEAYLRSIPIDPQVITGAVPVGPLITRWQQVIDLITLVITRRKVR